LVIAAAAGCLALAWWQWTRFESNAGDFQNLGYAMQWPLFAGFCVYAYFKFVRFEDAPPEPHAQDTVTEIPAGLLPERPRVDADAAIRFDEEADPALREYNAYLAELAKADDAQKSEPTKGPGT
jgi:DNA-binding transcriptional regulator of glucitol operon